MYNRCRYQYLVSLVPLLKSKRTPTLEFVRIHDLEELMFLVNSDGKRSFDLKLTMSRRFKWFNTV